MAKFITGLFFLLLTIAFGCGPPARVVTASAPNVDFTSLSTYKVNKSKCEIISAQVDEETVIDAVAHVLNSKGLQYAENADLEVIIKVFDVNRSQQLGTTYYPEYPKAEKYSEGTLTGRLEITSSKKVNFVEEWCIVRFEKLSTGEAIWEGGYVAKRDADVTSTQRATYIINGVKYVVKKYPD